MTNKTKKTGSAEQFEANWKTRKESFYNHWTPATPSNQIQFAFRQHWDVFSSIIGKDKKGKCLEVGCGRGSISSYFADAGWDTTLLDWSPAALEIAKKIFKTNRHQGFFVAGDTNYLPFKNEQFDVVVSIGLLEHFDNVCHPVQEHWRVLKPGGWFLGYIVPEKTDNVQRYFNWINVILKFIADVISKQRKKTVAKEQIFRNDYTSETYLNCLKAYDPEKIFVSGIYSVPMISHSPEFPFSLLPDTIEKILVKIFKIVVWMRTLSTGKHGWLCSEKMGQAFLIAAKK